MDDWKYARRNAYLIHCSLVEHPIDMKAALPLPFDEEEVETLEESAKIVELYEYAKSINYFGRESIKSDN